jgi:hypothetical protein
MLNLKRSEATALLASLNLLRDSRRAELIEDGVAAGDLMGCDEYATIARLQEKVADVVAKLPY